MSMMIEEVFVVGNMRYTFREFPGNTTQVLCVDISGRTSNGGVMTIPASVGGFWKGTISMLAREAQG